MKGVEGGGVKRGQLSVAESRNARFYKTKFRREEYILIHKESGHGKRRRRKERVCIGNRSEVISQAIELGGDIIIRGVSTDMGQNRFVG